MKLKLILIASLFATITAQAHATQVAKETTKVLAEEFNQLTPAEILRRTQAYIQSMYADRLAENEAKANSKVWRDKLASKLPNTPKFVKEHKKALIITTVTIATAIFIFAKYKK